MNKQKIIINFKDNTQETHYGTLIMESDAFFQIVTEIEVTTFNWADVKSVIEQ
jgi:hypothetical protein